MMKKIFAYQRVLLCSAAPAEVPDEQVLTATRTLFLLVIAVCVALGPLIGLSLLNLAMPVASVFIVYRILNGKNRLFEQVPVSRRFTAANILLFSFWMMAAVYILVAIMLLLILGVVVVLAMIFGSVQTGGPTVVNPADAAGEWKNIVFTLLIYLLILTVGTALSYIRNKRQRLIGIGLFSAALYAMLWGIKLSMPAVPQSVPSMNGIDLMPYFSLNPHAQSILIGLGIVCTMLIPGAIIYGFRTYIRQRA